MPRLWAFARDDVAQALVEFALTVPIFIFTTLVALQIAFVMGQYFNVMQVARETARWVAVHPHTVDTDVIARANELLRPGMHSSRMTSVAPTPACPSLDANGLCAARASGDALTLTITYDAADVVFLPTVFRVGGVVTLPTTLPTYRTTVLIE